jgi:hypothetical protein
MLNNFRKPYRLFAVIFLIVWAHLALAEDELCNVTPAQVAQAVVKIVAEQGLSAIQMIEPFLPQDNYEQLPSNTFELAEGWRLGTPLREHSITPKSLENYTEQHLFESVLIPLASWYVHVFISTRNYTYVINVNCKQGNFSVADLRYPLDKDVFKFMMTELDLTQAKLVNHFLNEFGYSFLAITNGGETTIYPTRAYSGQYDNLKPVDGLGGYKASDVITEMLLRYLITMNRRGNATISPDLKVHVPRAIFYYPTPQDIPTPLDLDFTFIPNPENRLLFEGGYKLSVD